MRLICEKNELQKSVTIVTKAIASKSTVNLLEGILIKVADNMMTLYGSDGTLSIKCTNEATVMEQGEIVLPARLFSEVLTKFDDCEVSMYTEGNNLVMECGHSCTTLCYMDAEGYPAFPKCNQTNSVTMYSKLFVSMIDQTVFSTSINEDKPILTGILLELGEGVARMVALDGYRLAIRKENLQSEIKYTEVVIPSKSMREIARIMPEDERTIKIFASDSMVNIICDNIDIATRVLQGDYVKYKNILTTEYTTRFIVDKQNLQNSLERASILARQSKTNLVHFKIDGDVLTITSDSEVGRAHEEVGIKLTGKNLSISFNSKYLLDVLREVEDEEIVFDLNTSISPCVVHPLQGDSYLYLVLPVKTNHIN
ncbi:MAG: DNA polymerase III subunit beta [Eubacteriales bacterium]|nr:DNA polymerase III subunit beta [Eubacteriales bacterium]